MEMADDKWKIAGDLCRCCLAEGSHNKLRVAKLNKDSGDNEDFANMLLENLGLTILPVKCVLSEITYTICNPCVERLRDVVSFRKQVQLSEEKFWNMYERNLLIAIEPIVVKVEDMETDDTYKGASDDGFNMDGFSDDDAQLNFIEIKAEAKKHKGKARAGTKAASAKKTPIRKMAARKTKTKTMMDAESVKAQKQKVKTEKTETIKTEEDEEDAPAEEKAPVKKNKGGSLLKTLLSTSGDDNWLGHYTSNRKPPAIAEQDAATDGSCTICGKTMASKSSKSHHISYHHKLEKCKHCPLFFTKSNMVAHTKAEHPGELPTCGICGFKNFSQVKVEDHQRKVHMKEKHKKCSHCDLKFFNSMYLRRHQLSHSNERRFQCDFCQKSFKRRGTLILHIKIHMGAKNKVCPVCAQAFVQKASLNYHMAKYHPGTRF